MPARTTQTPARRLVNIPFRAVFFVACFLVQTVGAVAAEKPFFALLEAGPTWISRNDARIPGAGGTRFSLNELTGRGPVLAGRVEFGHLVHRHGWRALVAPLTVRGTGRLTQSTLFGSRTFSPGVPTEGLYRFDSYRVSYVYRFLESEKSDGRIGFTGKIRDAEITLTQNGLTSRKGNTGLVPLAYFAFTRTLGSSWSARFDLDGLGAPQGRAIDAGLKIRRLWPKGWQTSLSVRTLEGGADNEEVFTFGWTHSLLLSVEYHR